MTNISELTPEQKEYMDMRLKKAIATGFTTQEEFDKLTDDQKINRIEEFDNHRPL